MPFDRKTLSKSLDDLILLCIDEALCLDEKYKQSITRDHSGCPTARYPNEWHYLNYRCKELERKLHCG